MAYDEKERRPNPLQGATVSISIHGSAEEVMAALSEMVLGKVEAAPAYGEKIEDAKVDAIIDKDAKIEEVVEKAPRPKSNGKAKAAKAPEPQPEPQETEGSAGLEGDDPEAEAEAPQDAASAVAAEKLKTETLDKLKDLFVAGKGKFVRDLLQKHGHGAKVFPEVEAKHFGVIAEAVRKELGT